MADSPRTELRFHGNCPDCGTREVHLPPALPDARDDFDWRVRDYDQFRMFMLEELAARFPERKRWTPADLEVVLVEAFAAMLDQLSDMLDRVAAERFLETARRPDTVRQLLSFIGYDAVAAAKAKDQIRSDEPNPVAALENYWRTFPHAMEQAKRAGPREIHNQKRMVTTEDYGLRLREHPLVRHAQSWTEWTGSWFTVRLAVVAWEHIGIDQVPNTSDGVLTVKDYSDAIRKEVCNFHEGLGLPVPDLTTHPRPTIRAVLTRYLDAMRMVGQEVILQDPIYVGIYLSLSVSVAANHFQSEVRQAIAHTLGHGYSGFFEPGRLAFGENIYAADIVQALMALDGVEHVCINSFKRVGGEERKEQGFIPIDGIEIAVCDNDALNGGYYRLLLNGGQRG